MNLFKFLRALLWYKVIRPVGVHVLDWLEVYFWAPSSILCVIGAAHLYYALTGRAPADPPDFFPELSGRFVLAILAVVATSISIHALIGWPPKYAYFSKPPAEAGCAEHHLVAIARIVAAVAILALWAYVFLH